MDIKLFVATKAFIKYQGKILIVRESNKYQDGSNIGLYDVVGGRVTPGERFDDSLRREAQEETGLDVQIGKPFFANEWRPQVKGEHWQIIGMFFECEANSDQVKLGSDHDDYKWIDPLDYNNYQLIDNLNPAFKAYLQLKK